MAPTAKQMKELVDNKNYDAIEAALDAGVDANEFAEYIYHTDCTLLYAAVILQDPLLADIALRYGGSPNTGCGHESVLGKAVREGSFSFCRQITEAEGFDPQSPLNRKACVSAERLQNESTRHGQIYRLLKNIFDAENGWKKLDDQSIQHVSRTPDQMIEMTTIFNFRAARLKDITRDYATNRTDIDSTYFADLPQNARVQVEQALEELKKQGGGKDIDPRNLSGTRHIQRSRNKQTQTGS